MCSRWNTPPGTKYLVTKPIPVHDQLLLLGPGMLKRLGGRVDELIQAWRAGKVNTRRGGFSSVADHYLLILAAIYKALVSEICQR